MNVGRKMTHNPITVKTDTPVPEAQAMLRREKIHRLPVTDRNGKLLGIVTEKDLIYASPSPASTLNVYEMSYLLSKLLIEKVMTKKVITVTEETTIEDAARIMVDNNIGGLPVVRDDKLVGIITESDIFKLFIELFGTRTKGIRATLLVPEKKGELAQLTSAIAKQGGNIISMGSFLGEDSTNVTLLVKVEGISKKDFLALIEPLVYEVIDIREA